MYQSATFNSAVPTTVGLLAETIRDPAITEAEVQQQLETADYEIQEIWSKPELIIGELVHMAAYKDNTLGNPLLCPKDRLPFINKGLIEKYRETFYKPERIVVAFAGVPHHEAVELTKRYFGDMEMGQGPYSSISLRSSADASDSSFTSPTTSSATSSVHEASSSSSSSSPPPPPPTSSSSSSSKILSRLPLFKNLSTSASNRATVSPLDPSLLQPSSLNLNQPSHYTGGFLALPPLPNPTNQLSPPLSHIHLAFEAPSISSPDIYALATLQTLLGGGGSFSAGGPGKGMYSRLYTHVLNQHSWVESCVAFNNSFTDSGIFGIAASCHPNRLGQMIDVMCRELQALGNDGNNITNNTRTSSSPTNFLPTLHPAEVNRAKNQLRSSLLMNLESRLIELEDLGRQVQVHGRRIGAKEMCRRIDALTVEDLRRVARSVFSGQVENRGKGTGAPTVVVQEAALDAGGGGGGGVGGIVGGGGRRKEIRWEEVQDRIARWGLGRL
jgi:mitochondrial-processing peptidase subunit alpha